MTIFAKEAIEFAIEKEQEAADFYNALAKRVDRPAIKEELLRFAAMEMGHKHRLQSLDLEKISFAPPAQDLKIANYLTAKEPSDDMSYADILTIAMERELASQRLYLDLAAITLDPAVRLVFKNLSAEEANHKNYFETIWDEKILTEN